MHKLRSPTTQITLYGLGLVGCYLAIYWLWDLRQVESPSQRILPVLAVYWTASLLALIAVWRAVVASRQGANLTGLLLAFAVVFRVIQLATTPILEIDLRRYLWDGRVALEGVSPYRYSPEQALADPHAATDPVQRRVIALAHRTEANHRIVEGVHYPHFTTIYPPVSQWVFAATVAMIPESASMDAHIFAMKAALTLFDLGVALVLYQLLRLLQMPSGWLAAYAWNPLVLKEVANSGHLDSIAVFFATLCVYWLVQWQQRAGDQRRSWTALSLSGVAWGLSVGAKLYPAILLPALLVAVARGHPAVPRRSRLRGRPGCRHLHVRATGFFLLLGVGVATITLMPMIRHIARPPAIAAKSGVARSDSVKEGLSSFLSRWEMNDLIFSVIMENAQIDTRDRQSAWYVVVPASARESVSSWVQRRTKSDHPGFYVARIGTLALFAAFASYALWRLWFAPLTGYSEETMRWLFLLLAVFFLLSPTENPWYWLWCLPLIPFARNLGWHAVSPCLLAYYSRFWFRASGTQWQFLGINYEGHAVFDYLVVWLEHLPMWIALIVGGLWLRRQKP